MPTEAFIVTIFGFVAALLIVFFAYSVNTDRLNKEACIAVGGDWSSGCINIPPTMRPTTEE